MVGSNLFSLAKVSKLSHTQICASVGKRPKATSYLRIDSGRTNYHGILASNIRLCGEKPLGIGRECYFKISERLVIQRLLFILDPTD